MHYPSKAKERLLGLPSQQVLLLTLWPLFDAHSLTKLLNLTLALVLKKLPKALFLFLKR